MSNLGTYQWITTTSKKVGGPVRLLLLVGLSGAAVYKGVETGISYCVKTIKSHMHPEAKAVDRKTYSVNASGVSNEGLKFAVGDKFRILESDGDSVLIEKIGDGNNPYFVSEELLHTISSFPNG